MSPRAIPYALGVRWDRFFEDLEDQLDSEWEAERAALDSEAERLRLSRIPLRERLVALAGEGEGSVSFDLCDETVLVGRVRAVGADWVAVAPEPRGVGVLVPLSAVVAVGLTQVDVVGSARAASAGSALRRRMSFGFVLRDLARKRVPVRVQITTGRSLTGTIDRAGADHFDLALHDADAPRRRGEIAGYRLVSLATVASVRPEASATLP